MSEKKISKQEAYDAYMDAITHVVQLGEQIEIAKQIEMGAKNIYEITLALERIQKGATK